MNTEGAKQTIIQFIKTQAGDKPVVLGLSGGIDSALVAYLAVEALGADKVHGLIMPSDTNIEEDLELAKRVTEYLNIQYSIFNIQPIIESYTGTLNSALSKTTIGNLKARTRMTLLYSKANELNGLVLGTGNKTEIAIGYFTKYGDGGVDILPIGDLYKTEVRELASYLNIPQEIIDRPPTAGLWEGQTDENEIGMTYENLDKILKAIENKKSLSDFNITEVERVQELIKKSEHKRALSPVCKIR
ncbi:MAG: NAD+ synthase [Candidatus Magasanikiibacteriota bacterium]